MELIAGRVGRPMDKPFEYYLDNTKSVRTSADFITLLSRYGRGDGRYDRLTDEDMQVSPDDTGLAVDDVVSLPERSTSSDDKRKIQSLTISVSTGVHRGMSVYIQWYITYTFLLLSSLGVVLSTRYYIGLTGLVCGCLTMCHSSM